MVKATGRAALILSAVFFLFAGDPSRAAPAASAGARSDGAEKPAETTRYVKHRRHYARHRTSKTAQKSEDRVSKKDATPAADAAPASSAMPSSVANANAQLAAADTPTAAAATAMTVRANDNVQAAADNTAAAPDGGSQVVASDQLNDVDRTLQQDRPPASSTVLAAAEAQPRPAPVMAASGSESSTWDQTSLIGKIFIGFGSLLTLASAARMFMA
jgi:hypothetical protein